MKNVRYNVLFRPEPEGGFTALVPSLPGCITYGKNLEEAKEMAMDAISLYVKTLLEDGESVPSDGESFSTSVELNIIKSKKRSRVYV